MSIRRVQELNDPGVPVLLDIYQQSFPLKEQMLISFLWKLLRNPSERFHLFVAEEANSTDEGEMSVLGFVLWEAVEESGQPVYLWYLAVAREARGKGLGETLYRFVIDTAFAQGAPAVAFEIEEENEVRERAGVAEADIARKRRLWYHRMGAKQLGGVEYKCGTDWQAAIPMTPMIHLAQESTPDQAYLWAKQAFGSDEESFSIVAPLILIP